MDVEASNKLIFCGGDDDDDGKSNLKMLVSCEKNIRRSASCEDFDKKRNTTTLPVKRVFDNNDFFCGSMKKSKVFLNDDNDSDVSIFPRIKRPVMSTDKLFSLLKEKIASVENSFEECKRMRRVEKKRLKSIKRDIEECSKELETKKREISCVERINEARMKMQEKVEECVKDFVAKEGQLRLMENLIEERKQEFETKELELRRVLDDISKGK
ncbi:hypothetical protein P8452_57846 [Trifolium repens]|nr:hypothetical protein P8452_57846 [Trifolium repens]